MGIQLVGISARTASIEECGRLALNEDQQKNIRLKLISHKQIDEVVIISTCNRTEIYCSGEKDDEIIKLVIKEWLLELNLFDEYITSNLLWRYIGKKAVHHLFLVTAGLDSQVIGEDQILGQVKQAFFDSEKNEQCKTLFHNLFRMAITASKKVKTKTMLSKSSVSTASLALKEAEKELLTLSDKKIMIIGATGKIGSILLKNALDVEGVEVYATSRHVKDGEVRSEKLHGQTRKYNVINYHDRYEYMNDMDAIFSATSSPHYTVLFERFSKVCNIDKKRVIFDLAVPMDIDEAIASYEGVVNFSMEDMQEIARENNEKKRESIAPAKDIIAEVEEEFWKNELYREYQNMIDSLPKKYGLNSNSFSKLFFKMKEAGSLEEYEMLLELMKKVM